jgi:DNA-binding CsgD family transcriptional regulator
MDAFQRALKDPEQQAFLVYGPAGTGKTRLAEECWKLARSEGRRCIRAVASQAARALPLGAIRHLLPADIERDDPVAFFARVVEQYECAGRRDVLFIDDLHLLDATSAVLIGQVLDAGFMFLIGTVRSGAPLPEAVANLDRGERGRRADLSELSLDQVDTLLNVVLGGLVERGASFQLHRASGGVLLFLRELVSGGLDAGTLVGDGGVWRLVGEPARTRRLVDLIEGRIRSAPAQDRAVLDAVALCGPVGTPGLDLDALSRLDRMGLVEVRADGRRTVVNAAHPLYGEVPQARMPLLERRKLLMEQAARLEGTGMRRREDRLRLATWRLDASGTADPDLLMQAASHARYAYDFGAVASLAAALTQLDTTAGPRMMLGEALYELGRFEEADAALQDAAAAARSDEEYLIVTLLRTQSLAWAALRVPEAFMVNAAARRRLRDPGAQDALRVDEAALLAYVGEVGRAWPLVQNLDEVADPRTRVMGAIPKAYILAESGRSAQAIDLARKAHQEHLGMPAVAAACHPGLHAGARVMALVEEGRVDEARRLGEDAYARVVADKALIAQLWLAIYLGKAEYYAGRMARARRWFAAAATVSGDHHFQGARWLALAGLMLTTAGMGDLDALEDAWGQAGQLAPPGHRRGDATAVSGWRMAVRGNLSRARDLLADAADLAQATGSFATEAHLLSDIARLGDPARVRVRLSELAAVCEGALTAARAAHAAALADRDPRQLEHVAGRLAAMGMILLAAESYTSAAELYRGTDQRRAAAASAQAARLAARCEGARTPGLALPAGGCALTTREREIALLAAGRLSSQEIADQLVISVRTVGSHLQQIYRKTGAAGRKDLRRALQALNVTHGDGCSPRTDA